MFKNYLTIAFRNIFRKATYSFVNVIGLATAITSVFFIATWVIDELTYDSHYPGKENIYRVVAEAGTGPDRWHQTVTSLPLGPTLKSTFPEVQAMVRFDPNDAVVVHGDDIFKENNIVLADPSFFEVFGFDLLAGNGETAISEPYQIVLTESTAKKYFRDENPMGQSLRMFLYDPEGNGIDYKITGIIKDPPEKSHFTFDILGSIATIKSARPEAMEVWGNNSYYTYVVLNDQADPKQLEAKFPQMVETHIGELIDEYDVYFRFYLQPITSIHLYSDLQYEFLANGKIEYVLIFSALGILILALAIINYVNLTTSFSLDRAREIGVRKVMGALKSELIWQHLTETVVLCMIAAMIAGLAVLALEPGFHQLTGKYYLHFNPSLLFMQIVMLTLPIGLLAGYFPARLLAQFNTLKSLKGKITFRSKNTLRSTLVAFQFMVTFGILVGVLVVQNQLTFVQNKDLGYDRTNLLVLRTNGSPETRDRFEPFKQELITSSGILNISRSGSMIVGGLSNSNGRVVHENGEVQFEKLYRLSVDHDYLDTYRIHLIAGRNFDPAIQSDSTEAFILNLGAADAYGWAPDEAIGKEMRFRGRDGKVIGIVVNFHYNTLRHEIEPACLYIRDGFSRITVRGEDARKMNTIVETAWKKHFPSTLYDYTFQDQALYASYGRDQQFGKIFSIAFVLAILIALLGLFGLVGHTVKKITKEIGIRKVLGATTYEILRMISYSFIRVVIFASLIALPFSWWIMDSWLSGFPYRIELEPWHFLVSAAIMLVGALSVVLTQSWRSSLANPAHTLKEE